MDLISYKFSQRSSIGPCLTLIWVGAWEGGNFTPPVGFPLITHK